MTTSVNGKPIRDDSLLQSPSEIRRILARKISYCAQLQCELSKTVLGRHVGLMAAYFIESDGEVKEAFNYDRQQSPDSEKGILEYARANYGANATLREMTSGEANYFKLHGLEFFLEQGKRIH